MSSKQFQNLVELLLGILAIAICGQSWQQRNSLRQSPLLPTLLLALMVFLAAFGIWAFSYLPRAVIVPVHLAGGIMAVQRLRKIGKAMSGLVVFQFVLGVFNVLLGLPLAGAVLHNATAMLLLITLVLLNYRLR